MCPGMPRCVIDPGKPGTWLRDPAGMRQMMWGDVEADTVHMRPMHAFTAQRVVFSPDRRLLDGMPRPARAGLLSVIAAYLPYYTSEREVPCAVHCLLQCCT